MSEETFEERKKRENKKFYEKWLSCGFKGKMEFDEHGWVKNGWNIQGKEKVVFDKGCLNRASLFYTQLPNGKWISGSDVFCRVAGHCHGLSIWNKQHDTKEEAVEQALKDIERIIHPKDKKSLMKLVEAVRNEFKQDTLFIPIATEQFEQVSLF